MTTCFVIGPIGKEHAPLGSPERRVWESSLEVYESVIRAACTFLGIEAIRADQISIAGDITDQIFRRLYEADLVIADITGANANVMYELGLRHSLNALTIQVADAETPLPFDVKAVRTIMINRTQYGLIDARKKLTAAIEMGLDGNIDMVSATRVWEALRSASSKDVSIYLGDEVTAIAANLVDDDTEGYFELMMGLAASIETVVTSTNAIGDCLIELGEETSEATQDMNSISESASDRERLNFLRKFATTLGTRAKRFDDLTAQYETDLQALDERVSPLLALMAEHEAIRDLEGADGFRGSIGGLAKQARESFENLGGFSESAKDLAVMTKMLREPSKLIARGVGRMLDSVTLLENWEAAVHRIDAGKARIDDE